MRVTESCARCLFDKQKHLSDNEEYLAEIRRAMNTEDIRASARISAAMSFTKLPVDQIPTIITGRTL